MEDSGSMHGGEEIRPLRDADATTRSDPESDPAQREWEDAGSAEDEAATATGRDPDEIPDPEDEIPAEDLPRPEAQPETQGADPEVAELGEDGQGDISPEDL
ncbi:MULTISPECIES: sugar ABC transporter ATPase [unclassified Microbacterium]|uniref:sugar ABC transporter ATPase n=1 Tax=unclassified Microbacterium TaxID=2609290 RepID=UPI0012FC8560|nr:sugar ABC transporter ATPase [Microbacterium sp. MAH-37]MVQ43274.1 sugar ABC transporter ATPase [Microbacterium sp. MAH-37]